MANVMTVPETFVGNAYASRRFSLVVQESRSQNPFYKRWIDDPHQVPIVDRTTFLENNDQILNGNSVTARTSGSTGVPVRVSHSTERQAIGRADQERLVRWLGGRLPCLQIVHPHSSELTPWQLGVSEPLSRQIEFITNQHRDLGAVAITTYPTNAEMLCREILERGIDMSFIRRVGVFAEAFELYQRAAIREAFPNAQIWTSYSSMEFDMIAAVCPHEPDFHHYMAHKLGLEILRDDDQPAADGELGRVVITDYFNQTSPLIRYEIGDFAIRGTCPCGRIPLPSLQRIVGKVRGALLHRNGQRVVFTDLSVALRDLPGMRQYQVIQDGLEEFKVRVVSQEALDAGIRLAFEDHFGYLPRQLEVEYVQEIPRGPNGKFYASICHI